MEFDLQGLLEECRRTPGLTIIALDDEYNAINRFYFTAVFNWKRPREPVTLCSRQAMVILAEWEQETDDLVLTRRQRLLDSPWLVGSNALERMTNQHNSSVPGACFGAWRTDDGQGMLDAWIVIARVSAYPRNRLHEEFLDAVCALCASSNDFFYRLVMLSRGFALSGTTDVT